MISLPRTSCCCSGSVSRRASRQLQYSALQETIPANSHLEASRLRNSILMGPVLCNTLPGLLWSLGQWCEIFFDIPFKYVEVGGTCSTYGRDVKCMQNFSGKITRKEVVHKTVGWNQMFQDLFCSRNFLDAVTNLRVVRFEVLTTMSVNLWFSGLSQRVCSLVGQCKGFRRTCCLHLQGRHRLEGYCDPEHGGRMQFRDYDGHLYDCTVSQPR